MNRPTPIDEEIKVDPKKYIVSRTNPTGMITYGNDYFIEISGYTKEELIHKPHNVVRHPDMPKVVFKMMWKRIQDKKNILALVKNLAKDGRYYWVVTDFESKVDPIDNDVTEYVAYRKAAPHKAVEAIEPFYKKLIEIEKKSGVDAAEEYLKGYFEAKETTYDEFIDDITGNKGIFKLFFKTMKKIFG